MKQNWKIAGFGFMSGAGSFMVVHQVVSGVNTGLPLEYDIVGLGALLAATVFWIVTLED